MNRRGTDQEVFRPMAITAVPEPARRYLTHALTPGMALPHKVLLRMRGSIKIGAWLPFRAEETLNADHGFRWDARVAGGLLRGHDLYEVGRGETRFGLFGALPLMRADGPDVARSALGRAIGELVWLPSALLPGETVSWSAPDEQHAVARVRHGTSQITLTLLLKPDGGVCAVSLARWGKPEGNRYGEVSFGVRVDREAIFDGITIPTHGSAGWWYGTDRWPKGEFFRFGIDDAVYR